MKDERHSNRDTESERYYLVYILGLIASILFFCMAMYLQIRDGYARDEGIYVPNFIGNGLWVLLIGCIVCFIIFLSVSKMRNQKLSKLVAAITCISLIVFGSAITIGWFKTYEQAKNGDIQSPQHYLNNP